MNSAIELPRQRYEHNKLARRLRRLAGQAIEEYNMIGDGERVMVCVSGGKDSYALLDLLLSLQRRAPVDFSIVAVHLDQRQPGHPVAVIEEYLRSVGVEYHILTEDTYSIVRDRIPEGRTMCSLCSRLRRGILYRFAREQGMTRIALGHHMDDMVETLFLNMFFGGRMKAMPPKLLSDDGRHVVIRPLAFIRERDLARYAEQRAFPVVPCNLCGSQDNLQRQQVKRMLADWERQAPGRVAQIFRAMRHIDPSQLADPSLFDFASLGASGAPASGWLHD